MSIDNANFANQLFFFFNGA